MEEIFPLFFHAKAIGITVLYADFNDHPFMLSDIANPAYMNLTVLDLGNNLIESVEVMKKLILPSLEKLWLSTVLWT